MKSFRYSLFILPVHLTQTKFSPPEYTDPKAAAHSEHASHLSYETTRRDCLKKNRDDSCGVVPWYDPRFVFAARGSSLGFCGPIGTTRGWHTSRWRSSYRRQFCHRRSIGQRADRCRIVSSAQSSVERHDAYAIDSCRAVAAHDGAPLF